VGPNDQLKDGLEEPADGFEQPGGRLAESRDRFESAGHFPAKKLFVAAVLLFGLLAGGITGYELLFGPEEVGGPQVMESISYPPEGAEINHLSDEVEQNEAGVTFPLSALKDNLIVGVDYQRTSPLPEDYQLAAGGNVLPVLAYVTPKGRMVTATSFCEPCRSTEFHLDGNLLVCDVCYTRWDVSTLLGVSGGCFDYPPEEVTASISGDQVVIPAADLEAWQPRAYQDVEVDDM